MSAEPDVVTQKAEAYYDSSDADEFYFHIWGGEDIHIGIYETPDEPIANASHRTVERMAARLTLGPTTRVLDLGAGYGGPARFLAREHGCHVTALNLSETQNRRNVELTRAAGLDALVDVVHGNFEALPFEADQFQVVWSQDAILHSALRDEVLREAYRVLAPGGELLFTDPMQADDCPEGVLQAVYDRIHLPSLGSFASYRATAKAIGFEEVGIVDQSEHLLHHYTRVRETLTSHYIEMCERASTAYVDRMLVGLQHWIDAAQADHLAWGFLHFRA